MPVPRTRKSDDELREAVRGLNGAGQVTRELNSGLFVPEAAEDTTVPIDIVDRPLPPPAPAPPLPQPTPPAPHPEPAQPSADAASSGAEAPGTANVPEKQRDSDKRPRRRNVDDKAEHDPPGPPKRTLTDALVGWVDARAAARREQGKERDGADDAPITVGAFVAICLMAVAVAALAFVLSFTMMYAAAKHYGWSEDLAKLFPLIIDVGAIGGTFMGAISEHRVYRSIGHQVLVVTLSASVLFNLVGHDIQGADALGLPTRWAWTGTVAAVMIPLLLAYFVHGFSKALKTFTDQRRETRLAAERAEQTAAEAERKRGERTGRHAVAEAAAIAEQEAPAAPVPAAARASQPHSKQRGARVLDAETARAWSRQNGNAQPHKVLEHFAGQGWKVPTDRTMRRWLNNS
ncbi:DUF2637 domain-containing protein (plasmid) [Amycolatopsis sp. FU40]|uniref:DUF2637 domain-containing protein n=1 Tax=Amycolatopsis sp. FU40 TaxID=2914159 RepID=UPI001F3A29FB|nr:DUF2637 domain-containing protein [Amycolatopsis sp. FU40]UKD50851.1 DUF2637 domain-containing protein [Amycolatopsis sp. FU40]